MYPRFTPFSFSQGRGADWSEQKSDHTVTGGTEHTYQILLQVKHGGILLIRSISCRESGVRNLRKQIEKIYRKAAFKVDICTCSIPTLLKSLLFSNHLWRWFMTRRRLSMSLRTTSRILLENQCFQGIFLHSYSFAYVSYLRISLQYCIYIHYS